MRMVRSFDAVTIFVPSGLKEAECTVLVCPLKIWRHIPVIVSQMRAVWSPDADAIYVSIR